MFVCMQHWYHAFIFYLSVKTEENNLEGEHDKINLGNLENRTQKLVDFYRVFSLFSWRDFNLMVSKVSCVCVCDGCIDFCDSSKLRSL